MSTASLARHVPLADRGHRLSLEHIERASLLIHPVLLNMPQLAYGSLSRSLGCTLTLKNETANPVGCFKGRGAEFFVARMLARGEDAPLVCASAGNFGLALAYSSARRGLRLTVFVSESASPVKVDAIRRYGARIVTSGRDFDAAKDAARTHAVKNGERFVEDGAEPEISEGAGTIAVELFAGARYDCILVPLGNGALLAGIGRWVKAHSPNTRIIGVCSAGARVMFDCWSSGAETSAVANATAQTIADGIAVRVPVPAAVSDLRPLVDDIRLVDDAQLIAAMRLTYTHTGFMCEPSAVAGIAALSADPQAFAGQRVATVLTGCNLTAAQIQTWFSQPTLDSTADTTRSLP
jgi:threonine dehydratase